MAYLTEADYIARFGADELAQVLATDASLTLAAATADAESIVNGYLAAVSDRTYAVPLATVPARIVELTADLTRYELHAKKATEEISKRRDQAIAFLEAMVAGTVSIPELTPGAGAVPEVISGLDLQAECRVFSACSLRGYVGR